MGATRHSEWKSKDKMKLVNLKKKGKERKKGEREKEWHWENSGMCSMTGENGSSYNEILRSKGTRKRRTIYYFSIR